MIFLTLLMCFLISIFITPLVKKLAYKIRATDRPNTRKVHQKLMPRLGGLAIYIAFLAGVFILQPVNQYSASILIGSGIIVISGILDDMFELSAKFKLLAQVVAAAIIVLYGGLQITFINLPFGGLFEFGFLSIPFTFLWIIGITNAINLIDGLDGLAAGVSSIALVAISGMAFIMGNLYVVTVGSILLISTLGFLYHNFYPAKIFMGDTGALFLGFMISVLSLLGFKNITFVSFIVPIIILGVPISDTIFAILRRIINKQPLSSPDKSHLHHCLLRIGFSHRETVLLIYAMAALFAVVAVVFSQAKLWGAMLLGAVLLFFIELIAEKIGLFGREFNPLLKLLRTFRFSVDKNRKKV
ncbi:UDP-GlcNAc:undecaprenyl-phosphate GlcNAc-1-phosphate transferase [Bacillus niacini]|jgi:UDP-GlcNAc:undecaprenyl-phosphate/decaprenyl-phosphate GlcNAc-1-phosphate transferase|uniref:UDP-GlcNAc:undecaprenyl-phosphate GlcNAc-1-phosphate transferase n=1 Tax=Neobacillus niacini TaxID=86668 RepID=A0A852T4X1_9BACI|nr:MraY family glycosyltransferase [Neobacillus niacini]NYE03633.1 UDP-GlcNAc:undecaprenyl-phosphate GlcNAc-1-phosphate transferase [Neobacillus niacini]